MLQRKGMEFCNLMARCRYGCVRYEDHENKMVERCGQVESLVSKALEAHRKCVNVEIWRFGDLDARYRRCRDAEGQSSGALKACFRCYDRL